MTWNWKWSLAATGATAMAGWLASPPVEPAASARGGSAVVASQSDIAPAAVAEIQEQARRLSTRLAPKPLSPSPTRNPFQFGARPVTRRAPDVAARPAVVPPPVEVPMPFPLQLTGIAVDTVNGVETRTAIISGPGGLELARAGDAAGPGYRVVTVGETFAEVERLSDGTRERLVLAR
jgi:hypothetical protein